MVYEAEWIAGELGKEIPLHLSKYFPMHKRTDRMTSDDSLLRLYDAAASKLSYVYFGNIDNNKGHDTTCPYCETIVTKRTGYNTRLMFLSNEGNCGRCGRLIYKNFKPSLPKGH
jgi:pyruvate formate lyase activating enzyme